jgi:uncharacterized protein YndB with AHSA1/START domain
VSLNRIVIDASPTKVFEILTDVEAYPDWVVGAKAIRGRNRTWPRKGSRFFHKIGGPGVTIKDSTEVLEIDPPVRLKLEVRFRHLGVGVVDMHLSPLANGAKTLVTMSEEMIGGPLDHLPARLIDPVLQARNRVSLGRLGRLATERVGGKEPNA